METAATPAQERAGLLWYCLTPDLDVYPHLLAVPPLVGIAAFNNDGSVIPKTSAGSRWSGRSAAYGSDEEPTPLEFLEAIEA